jgi:hypothetical protein
MYSLDDVANLTCGSVMLEPRLQEYLKKKQLYKKNNITSCTSLEQQYMIIPEDISRIKAFYNGDRNIYDYNKQTEYIDLVEPQKFFPSDTYKKKDTRMQNIKNKQLDHVKANEQRNDFSNLQHTQQRITPYTNNVNNKQSMTFSDPPFNSPNNMQLENYYNSHDSKIESRVNHFQNDSRVYHDTPKIEYKNKLPYKQEYCEPRDFHNDKHHDHKVNDIIGDFNEFKGDNIHHYHKQFKVDNDLKVRNPSNQNCINNSKNLNWDKYRPVRDINSIRDSHNSNKNIDVDAENEMIMGMPTRTLKSYGFKNPVEHHFDYITNDIQTPNHTVMSFPRGGYSTREMNHQTSRPYTRNVM